MPSLFDHLLALGLVFVLPLLGARTLRGFRVEVEVDATRARLQAYAHTILVQWLLVGIVLLHWWTAGRGPAAIGLVVPPGNRSLAGAVVTLAVMALLIAQWRSVMRDPAKAEEVRAQMGDVTDLMPRTDREAARFRALAVTAGVCEETLYRGFLIWYLATMLGLWPAVLAASIVFGAAHFYQGAAGMARTGAVGLVAAVLFVGTGSLLWPILLHIAVDLQGGAMARRALALPLAEARAD